MSAPRVVYFARRSQRRRWAPRDPLARGEMLRAEYRSQGCDFVGPVAWCVAHDRVYFTRCADCLAHRQGALRLAGGAR